MNIRLSTFELRLLAALEAASPGCLREPRSITVEQLDAALGQEAALPGAPEKAEDLRQLLIAQPAVAGQFISARERANPKVAESPIEEEVNRTPRRKFKKDVGRLQDELRFARSCRVPRALSRWPIVRGAPVRDPRVGEGLTYKDPYGPVEISYNPKAIHLRTLVGIANYVARIKATLLPAVFDENGRPQKDLDDLVLPLSLNTLCIATSGCGTRPGINREAVLGALVDLQKEVKLRVDPEKGVNFLEVQTPPVKDIFWEDDRGELRPVDFDWSTEQARRKCRLVVKLAPWFLVGCLENDAVDLNLDAFLQLENPKPYVVLESWRAKGKQAIRMHRERDSLTGFIADPLAQLLGYHRPVDSTLERVVLSDFSEIEDLLPGRFKLVSAYRQINGLLRFKIGTFDKDNSCASERRSRQRRFFAAKNSTDREGLGRPTRAEKLAKLAERFPHGGGGLRPRSRNASRRRRDLHGEVSAAVLKHRPHIGSVEVATTITDSSGALRVARLAGEPDDN